MRFLAFLWDLVGLLLLVILFVEFGLDPLRRLIRGLRHKAADPNLSPGAFASPSRVEAVARAMRLDWAPYVHWRQRPYQDGLTTVDERGLRRTVGEDRTDSTAIRVFCFGSSTLFCLGVRDEATIPSVLQRLLSASGRRVAVSNHAQLAYNSSQGLLALQQLLKQGDVPDVALFYDGFNDMFAAEWKGRADVIRGEEARRAEFFLLEKNRRGDFFCVALASLIPRTLRRLHEWTGFRVTSGLPDAARTSLREDGIPRLAREVVSVYVANIRAVRALAREYGFATIFVWEPVLATKTNKSDEEAG